MQFKRLFLLLGIVVGLGTAVSALASGPLVEPDATILQTFTGEQVGDAFGWVAENLGDINGDGANDAIVAAPFYTDENGNLAGKVYIFSGADGTTLNTITGNGFEVLGYSASAAGDVNNDGTPDYIVGGIAASHVVVYSGADHTVLLELHGVGGDRFGSAVAKAGDVNGDGYGDVLVGAERASDTFFRAGRAYLFSGYDGSLLWSVGGNGVNYLLGSAAGMVGDVTGDGVPDQVFGAYGAPGASGTTSGGRAYVFSGTDGALIYTLQPENSAVVFGQFFASGAGDVDGDGVPDIYVGDYNDANAGAVGDGRAYLFSGANGRRILLFNGRSGEGLGPGRGVGDLNGDGHADVIIAAYTSSRGAAAAGKIYVYSGQGHQLLQVFTGAIANDNLGVDALGMGDVNGDGKTDFLITAVGNNFLGLDVGRAYIVAGE